MSKELEAREAKVLNPEMVKAGKEKRRTEPTRYERFAWFYPVEDELSQQADAEQNAEFLRIPESEQPVEGDARALQALDPNEQPQNGNMFTEEDAKLLRSSAPQNPDSLFATMMDVGKPAQYAYDDRRYRSADRLGRSVSPFLDSAVAQGIYKDADARRQQYMQRAREGEENVLQRRTTAENMWGHYSPAITQSLTNAGIFMQRAFQAREEGDKLMEAKRANDVVIAEREKNLKARFNNLKQHGYVPKQFDWEKFSANLDAGVVPRVSGKETSKLYDDLLVEYRALSDLRAKSENLAAEADKQYGLEVKSDTAAAAQADFAKRSHEFFGFPSLNLYSAQKGIRNTSGHSAGENTNSYIRGIGQEPDAGQVPAGAPDGKSDFEFVRTFDFSTATPEGIKRLQGIVGTNPDGVVGPKTRKAYRNYLGLPEDKSGPQSKTERQNVSANGVAKPAQASEPEEQQPKYFGEALSDYRRGMSESRRAHNTWDSPVAKAEDYDRSEKIYKDINGRMVKAEAPEVVAESFNWYRQQGNLNTNENFQKLDPRLRQWTTQDLVNLVKDPNLWTAKDAGLSNSVSNWVDQLDLMVRNGDSEKDILAYANQYLTVSGQVPESANGATSDNPGGAQVLNNYLKKFDDVDFYTDSNGERQLVLIPKGYKLVERVDSNGNKFPYMEKK